MLLRILLLLLKLWLKLRCGLVLHGLSILLILHLNLLHLLLLLLPWVLLIAAMHPVLMCGRPSLLLQPRTL